MNSDTRWKQRFQNFDRSLVLLREALERGPGVFEKAVDAIAARYLPALEDLHEFLAVRLFGSRAKGTHTPRSDVDLAIWGDVDAIRAEAISAELDELPLPYHFDVKPFGLIKLASLRDHIQRVGLAVYP